MEVFTKFSTSFDGAVKNMSKLAADQTQKCQTHFKREFQTIGKSFQQLGDAMGQDGGTCTYFLKMTYTKKIKVPSIMNSRFFSVLSHITRNYCGLRTDIPASGILISVGDFNLSRSLNRRFSLISRYQNQQSCNFAFLFLWGRIN